MSTKETPFNLNQRVKVKLTDYGKHRIDHKREFLKKLYPNADWSDYRRYDEDGWLTLTLWSLMELFEGDIGPGLTPPYETTIYLLEN